MTRDELVALLAAEGFVAAEEEADELVAAAGDDPARLDALTARRRTGEPLAWIVGGVDFAGRRLAVAPGVYVPRWHTELLARRATELLPPDGCAVDLCCGCGAIAATLIAEHPRARVVATDLDPAAVACARANGVDAVAGDLFAPLPPALRGAVDLVTGVPPYVPTGELGLLQRDTFTFESRTPYDGGPDGAAVLQRIVSGAPEWLRPGGTLLLELGGALAERLRAPLSAAGFAPPRVLVDEEGDVRGVETRRG